MHTIFKKRARRLATECERPRKKRKLLKHDNMILSEDVGNILNTPKELYERYKSVILSYYSKKNPNMELLYSGNGNIMEHQKYPWLATNIDAITSDGKILKISCLKHGSVQQNVPHNHWMQVQIQLEIARLNICNYIECKIIEPTSKSEYNKLKTDCIASGVLYIKNEAFRWVIVEYKQHKITVDHKWFKSIIPLLKQFKDKTTKEPMVSDEILDNNDVDINYTEWVSATKTRNYLIDDTLCDYLDLYRNRNKSNGGNKKTTFMSELCKKGIDFENAVINYIYKTYPEKIKVIADQGYQRCMIQKFKETFNEMKNGLPFISQAVLYNFTDKTYGIADLLVRADYINKLFKNRSIPEKNMIKLKQLNNNYYYVVIDIKLSKLHLTSDGVHLQNRGNLKAYKGQVLVYNRALAQLQGYDPGFAYLLGRRWSYAKTVGKHRYTYGNNNCLDRPGKVDFNGKDKFYNEKVDNAIEWIRLVRSEGDQWSLNPMPSRPELYPNMCNNQDYPHGYFKKRYAKQINEISSVFNCGPAQRRCAHQANIIKWTDPKCTAKSMGVRGPKKSRIIDCILKTNRGNVLVTPNIITNNESNWKNCNAFYVDIESVPDIASNFNNIPYSNCENIIFMVGLGWIHPKTNTWHYKCFCAKKLTGHEEQRILNEWYYFMEKLANELYEEMPQILHYCNHEKYSINNSIKKHKLTWRINTWLDVYKKIIYREPVCVKGALSLSLKAIGNALYKHGLIESTWPVSTCLSGKDAMTEAKKCHDTAINIGVDMNELPMMKKIITYNHADCKILYEIVDYLRNNHT